MYLSYADDNKILIIILQYRSSILKATVWYECDKYREFYSSTLAHLSKALCLYSLCLPWSDWKRMSPSCVLQSAFSSIDDIALMDALLIIANCFGK